MSSARLIDESLFTDAPAPAPAGTPALAGGRCPECRTTTFPFQGGCPKCGSGAMERVALPREGRLWAFTVQGFEPKSPYRGNGAFEPFGVGYIDLGDVCVASRLTVNDPTRLAIGDPFELVLTTAFREGDTDVVGFAFAPVSAADNTEEQA